MVIYDEEMASARSAEVLFVPHYSIAKSLVAVKYWYEGFWTSMIRNLMLAGYDIKPPDSMVYVLPWHLLVACFDLRLVKFLR